MANLSKREAMEQILAVWEKFPTLRLGQLMINCLPLGGVPYYVSDEQLVKLLQEYQEKHT